MEQNIQWKIELSLFCFKKSQALTFFKLRVGASISRFVRPSVRLSLRPSVRGKKSNRIIERTSLNKICQFIQDETKTCFGIDLDFKMTPKEAFK